MRGKARKFLFAGIIFLLLFAVLYTKEEVSLAGNESSRFAVVQAFGEQGVFHIEGTNFASTVDKLERNGHLYSDKPLPLSFCAALIHGVIYRVTGINFTENRMLAIYLVNLLISGGCSILLFLLMYRHLRRTSRGRIELKFLLALALPLTTWLGSYSVVLNNHTPAALALFGMIVALEKYRRKPTLQAAAFTAGCAGIAGAFEIPLGVFAGMAALIGIYLSSPPGGKTRPCGVVVATGGAICLAVLLLNFIAYGTVVPLYVADGSGSFKIDVMWAGIPGYSLESLLGFRGLFSYQPFLLLIFPAVWFLRKRLRISDWCGVAAAAALIVFYMIFTNEYGGASYGMRYLIPVIPVFWLVISRWILSWKMNAWKAVPVILLLIWGGITMLVGAYCPFCIANEGIRTPEGHFSSVIRSPFWGNLLVMNFEREPEGKYTQMMIDSFGPEYSFLHLYHSGIHMRKPELVAQLLQSSLAERVGVKKPGEGASPGITQ